jgi:hypothetical protein
MRKTARYALVGAVVGTFGLAGATQSEAQVCVGFPNAAGQLAVGLTTSFPTGGNTFGAEAGYNFAGPLSAFAGLTVDTRGDDDVTGLGGGIAFEVPAIGALLPAGIQACPTVSIRFTDIDVTDAYAVPIGVGLGTTLGLEGALSLSPYVIPQLALLRGPDDDDSFFMLDAGALVGFAGNFYAGAQVNRSFRQGGDSVFGIKVGVTF